MKTLILAILLGVSGISLGEPLTGLDYDKAIMGNPVPGTCYAGRFFRYTITHKIEDKYYQMVSTLSAHITPAVVMTNETSFAGPGALRGIGLEFVGTKDLTTEDGFARKFYLWRECKVKKG